MPDDIVPLYTRQFSDFVIMLWCRNPNSEMNPRAAKIPQPPKMRYSEKDFTTELPWFHSHEQLYALLRQYWPCTCQKSHKDKLGDCENIMLRLRSNWTHPGLPTGEFHIKLYHGQSNINCNVCVQSEEYDFSFLCPDLPHTPGRSRLTLFQNTSIYERTGVPTTLPGIIG